MDGTVQHIMKHAITLIIVFRTFNSVRDNLLSVVAPVACCWTSDYRYINDDDDKEEKEE